jgi:hypothetical protein
VHLAQALGRSRPVAAFRRANRQYFWSSHDNTMPMRKRFGKEG